MLAQYPITEKTSWLIKEAKFRAQNPHRAGLVSAHLHLLAIYAQVEVETNSTEASCLASRAQGKVKDPVSDHGGGED